MRKFIISSMAVAVLISGLLVGCGSPKGTLQFKANGEDFVRQGFVSKDGWAITFEHIYVNLTDITAYQCDPPYDPHEDGEIKAKTKVALEGTHTVDLAKGDENASPILVGEVTEAPTGHYNAISWKMIPASSGPADGHSLIIDGTAKKDGQVIQFAIKDGSEYLYACGEYVGDERKGFVEKDSPGEVEMTFHFDHIFGDAETLMDDELNVGAPGFAPFAQAAKDGTLDASLFELESMLSAEEYQMLIDILPTLGHVGEGHCHCEVR